MEKLERENKRLQILIIILMALLIAFGGNYFYENVIVANKGTTDDKAKEIITDEVNKETKEYTKEELLTLLRGTWISKEISDLSDGDTTFYVADFYDNIFETGQYKTDILGGNIKSVSLIENDKYKLSIHDDGCHGDNCKYTKEAEDFFAIIDVKDIIASKIIYLNISGDDADYRKFNYLSGNIEDRLISSLGEITE